MRVQTFKGVNYAKINQKPTAKPDNGKFMGCPPKPCQRPDDRKHRLLSWC